MKGCHSPALFSELKGTLFSAPIQCHLGFFWYSRSKRVPRLPACRAPLCFTLTCGRLLVQMREPQHREVRSWARGCTACPVECQVCSGQPHSVLPTRFLPPLGPAPSPAFPETYPDRPLGSYGHCGRGLCPGYGGCWVGVPVPGCGRELHLSDGKAGSPADVGLRIMMRLSVFLGVFIKWIVRHLRVPVFPGNGLPA